MLSHGRRPGPHRHDAGGRPVSAQTGQVGVVYLLHFSKPYKHARHYTGWTESSGSLKARLARHERG
jgi:hypothetical protein